MEPDGTRRRRRHVHPLVHLLAAVVLLALLQGFVVKPFQVPTASMAPTLQTGDRVLVDRLAYVGAAPARGDVVVFERPEGWGSAPERGALRQALGVVGDLTGIGPSNLDVLVKRVIGVGGDVVSCCDRDGAVLVGGEPLDEPYLGDDLPFEPGALDCATEQRSPRCFPAVEVPEGSLLLLGDHRAGSSDSATACRGAVDGALCARLVGEDAVVGEVVAVVLPLDRVGGTPSIPLG